MKLSKRMLRLLSGLLCFCLIFQSLTISAFASEAESAEVVTEIPVAEDVTGGNTEDAEPAGEAVALVVSGGDIVEVPAEEQASADSEAPAEENVEEAVAPITELQTTTECGTFSNLKVVAHDLGVAILDGTFTLTDSTCGYSYISVDCYDDEDNLLGSMIISGTGELDSNGSTPVKGSTTNSLVDVAVPNGTAYVKIVANCSYGTDASSEKIAVDVDYSKEFFSVEDIIAGSGTAAIDWYCNIGTMGSYNYNNVYKWIYAEWSYGTSTVESTWTTKNNTFLISDSVRDGSIECTDLEPNTKYYGKIRFYTTFNGEVAWEQIIELPAFTTKESSTYNLKTAFPDETFRAMILEKLQSYDSTLTEDSDVTSGQLEEITQIHGQRSSTEEAAIKDITGVELLTGLTLLYLDRHEIESVDTVDWSKLSRLENLSLEYNEFSVFPNLSGCERLLHLNLEGNRMTDEELLKGVMNLPSGIYFYEDNFNQRLNGFELLVEENYYVYGSTVPLKIQMNGAVAGLDYTAKVYLDDVETEMTLDVYSMTVALADSGLSVGEHTIKVELYSGETKLDETDTYTFNVVDEPFFMEKDVMYYYNGTSSNIYVYLYATEAQSISSMRVVNDEGVVYSEGTSVSSYTTTSDPRSTTDIYDSNRMLYRYYANMNNKYNMIPAGSYNLLLTYSDDTTKLIEDYIQVVGSEDSVIIDSYSYSSYDSTGEYLYLFLNGANIKPDQLDYTLTWRGQSLDISYVSSKEVSNGYVVKLQKAVGLNYLLSTSLLTIAPKSGYELLNGSFVIDNMYTGQSMYYCDYNYITGQVEAAFNDSLDLEGKKVTLELALGYDATSYPAVATATAVVTDGIAYFDFKDENGLPYEFARKSYYVRGKVGSYTLSKSFYADVNTSSVNYWSSPAVAEGTETVSIYYYTDIPYGEVEASEYTATISGGDAEATRIWIYKNGNTGNTTIGMSFDISDYPAGSYSVDLYRNGEAATQTQGTVTIRTFDTFVLSSISTSWEDGETISIYRKPCLPVRAMNMR